MVVAAKKLRPAEDRYMELVRRFPLRPIRTAEGSQQAKELLRSLMGDNAPEVLDYRTVLLSLIVEYEKSATHGMDAAEHNAADIVRYLLKESGLSINAFAKKTGMSQSSLTDMLNGRRTWSKSAIVKVADYFNLDYGLFLR